MATRRLHGLGGRRKMNETVGEIHGGAPKPTPFLGLPPGGGVEDLVNACQAGPPEAPSRNAQPGAAPGALGGS
jgi:hypothetical protein